MNIKVITIDKNSATTIEAQMPSTSKNNGRINTAANWKIRVLQNDINAEINPLLSPVKKAEPNMENPANI